MNALNVYLTVLAVTGGLVTAVVGFLTRKKHQDEVDFYQGYNNELRAQNADLRTQKTDLEADLAGATAKSAEQAKRIADLQELNSKQPDFAGLTKLLSNNHKQVMAAVTRLASKIVDKSAEK